MWAEFYNLASEEGITFGVVGISICGGVFRIAVKGRGSDSDWAFVN